MFIFLILLVQFSWAAEVADPTSTFDPNYQVPDTTKFHPRNSAAPAQAQSAATSVEKELLCIRGKTEGKLEMIKMPAAEPMIKHLAPYLQKGFADHNESPLGRALFYAQAIEESGGFTQLSEASTVNREGVDAIANEITDAINDVTLTPYTGKKTLPASMKLGAYRGRSLLQLTGCANYLSVMHYLNQQYSGEKEWVYRQHWPDWKDAAGKPVELEPAQKCSDSQLQSFEKMYNNKYSERGWHANLYNTLYEPRNFSRLNHEFTDPVSKKKIDSEKLMVDGSLAYWHGQCDEVVRVAANPAKLKSYAGCKDYHETECKDRKGKKCIKWGPKADQDYANLAARCVTKCIKGSTEGWERRAQWLRLAMQCSSS